MSAEAPTTASARRRPRRVGYRLLVLLTQVALTILVLLLWEFLPKIDALSSNIKFLDPFFISSPSQVGERLVDLVTGTDGSPSVWPYVWPTFGAALAGTIIGLVVGGFVGLLMSSFEFLSAVIKPFIVALNAVPRIALIPIIVILMGQNIQSSIAISVMVVFFVGVFNAYEGGRTAGAHLIQNATLLGASKWDIMGKVRFPYALAWTLASLPVAVSFSILTVVTGEILTGVLGLGRLIVTATSTAQASLTFAVVIVLSVLAIAIVAVAELFKRRILHWWIEPGAQG